MAATTDVIIVNQTNGYQILLRGVSTFRPKKSQVPIQIPLIGNTPGNNFLFRFAGQSEEIGLTFALFDDGTDVSNGTFPSQVTSIGAQVSYIKNNIFTEEFDTTWTIKDNNGVVYATAVTGIITSLELELGKGAQTVIPGSLTFIRGRIGLL